MYTLAALLINAAGVLWSASVALRFRTMQAGPVMQMPVFLILFFAPVYVPLDLLHRLDRGGGDDQPDHIRARGGAQHARRRGVRRVGVRRALPRRAAEHVGPPQATTGGRRLGRQRHRGRRGVGEPVRVAGGTVKLQHEFEVPASPDETLALLLDPERVVACMPGATLVEIVGDGTWKTAMAVKIGPVGMDFLNDVSVVEQDNAAGTVQSCPGGSATSAAGRGLRGSTHGWTAPTAAGRG